MERPFFRNYYWNNARPSRPRYATKSRGIPVNQVKSDPRKVVSIPVHFVASAQRSSAAIRIQSVFRGFLVRKNVRTIAKIKSEVDQIAERIKEDETVDLIRKDAKERVRMNEMLMGLLFRLDSVRGIDTGVRDFRKSVIRKVILLQEGLDSIASSLNEVYDLTEDSGADNCSDQGEKEFVFESVAEEEGRDQVYVESAGNYENLAENGNRCMKETLEKLDPVQETLEKQDPIQKTLEKQDPIQETLEKQDPIQETLEHKPDSLPETPAKQCNTEEALENQESLEMQECVEETPQNHEHIKENETLEMRRSIEETLEETDPVEGTLEEQGPDLENECLRCENVAETLGTRNMYECAENHQSTLERESCQDSDVATEAPENRESLRSERCSEGKAMDPMIVDGDREGGSEEKDMIRRLMEQNERLTKLVTELSEKSSLQNRVMDTLSQRVQQLERFVRSERCRRKKKRVAAVAVDTADVRKCGRK